MPERSFIERALARIIASKTATDTRAEYTAQLQALFPKQPTDMSFESFCRKMREYGFVNKDELRDTFSRFEDSRGRIQFRKFCSSLVPFDHTCDLVTQMAREAGVQTARSSQRGSSSARLGATGSIRGTPSTHRGSRAASRQPVMGFGRRATYVTDIRMPPALDPILAIPAGSPQQAHRSYPKPDPYETSYMYSNTHLRKPTSRGRIGTSQQSTRSRKKDGVVWRFATGVGEMHGKGEEEKISDNPRVATWITASDRIAPPKVYQPGMAPRSMNVLGGAQKTATIAQPYMTKYMLDTDPADRPVDRAAKVVKPSHSQSGISMIAMGSAPTWGLIEHTKNVSAV